MEAKIPKPLQVQTKNMQLDPKYFQKILVLKCCVTLFVFLCPAYACHFSVFSQPVLFFFFFSNGQFSIKWVLLVSKFL